MYCTLDMKKKGLKPLTWELDIHDTLTSVDSTLDHLISRCLDDKDCDMNYIYRIRAIKQEVGKLAYEDRLCYNAVRKNPEQFKD